MSQVQSGSNIASYQQHAASLGAKANVEGQYQIGQKKVNGISSQIQAMNQKQLADAQGFAKRARRSDLLKQAAVTQSLSLSKMQSGQQAINKQSSTTESKVGNEFRHGVVV